MDKYIVKTGMTLVFGSFEVRFGTVSGPNGSSSSTGVGMGSGVAVIRSLSDLADDRASNLDSGLAGVLAGEGEGAGELVLAGEFTVGEFMCDTETDLVWGLAGDLAGPFAGVRVGDIIGGFIGECIGDPGFDGEGGV